MSPPASRRRDDDADAPLRDTDADSRRSVQPRTCTHDNDSRRYQTHAQPARGVGPLSDYTRLLRASPYIPGKDDATHKTRST